MALHTENVFLLMVNGQIETLEVRLVFVVNEKFLNSQHSCWLLLFSVSSIWWYLLQVSICLWSRLGCGISKTFYLNNDFSYKANAFCRALRKAWLKLSKKTWMKSRYSHSTFLLILVLRAPIHLDVCISSLILDSKIL